MQHEDAIMIREETNYEHEQERASDHAAPDGTMTFQKRTVRPANQLSQLSGSDVHAGEEYGTYRVPRNAAAGQQAFNVIDEADAMREVESGNVSRHLLPGVVEPYFSEYEYPLISIPVRQIQSTYIAKVACGLEHALLLTSSAFVYSMGCNSRGQLGQE